MKRSESVLQKLRRRFSRETPPMSLPVDDFFLTGEVSSSLRDRPTAGFRNVIDRSLTAWREDPLARRIVSLTTQFSVGRGFRVSADDPAADELLRAFWEHPLNRMDARLLEWSDELCRTGNLFILLSSDPSGMSFVRAIPAGQIESILSKENDIEQPALFRVRESIASDSLRIPDLKTVLPASLIEPDLSERMLHFTVNRPVGAQWGEPDLAPLLEWLNRYQTWMKDRMKINHYRSAFIYMVRGNYYSEQALMNRQSQLNRQPPAHGQIMVVPENEQWSVLQPNLASGDANEDGLSLKKLIAAGAGIPVSFLAEAASSSKAESSGMEDSACRNFRQRQQTLLWLTETVLRHVLARAALVNRELNPDCEIHVYGDDIAAPGLSEGGIVHDVSEEEA